MHIVQTLHPEIPIWYICSEIGVYSAQRTPSLHGEYNHAGHSKQYHTKYTRIHTLVFLIIPVL
jgi:hypothetical protein